MSLPLLLKNLKRYALLWGLFVVIFMLYLLIIASIYDPASMQSLDAVLGFLPQGMLNAFGFQLGATSLTGFIVSFFFGFLCHILALFFTLLISHGLVAKLSDSGSLSYLLASPVSRRRIIQTQAITLFGGLVLLFFVPGSLCALLISRMFPGLLDTLGFFRVLSYNCLVALTMAAFCLLVSCSFSTSRRAVGVSAGGSVLMLLLLMFGNVGPKYAFLKHFTPYAWLDALSVLQGGDVVVWCAALLLVLLALLTSAAYVVFTRRQMAL